MTAPPTPSQAPPLNVVHAQRRAVSVLSVAAAFGGIAISGSIPAGSLLTASIADSEAVAGLALLALAAWRLSSLPRKLTDVPT